MVMALYLIKNSFWVTDVTVWAHRTAIWVSWLAFILSRVVVRHTWHAFLSVAEHCGIFEVSLSCCGFLRKSDLFAIACLLLLFSISGVVGILSVARLFILTNFRSSIVYVRRVYLYFWDSNILRSLQFRSLHFVNWICQLRYCALMTAGRLDRWSFTELITADETCNRQLSLENVYCRALCSDSSFFSLQLSNRPPGGSCHDPSIHVVKDSELCAICDLPSQCMGLYRFTS